MKEPLIVIGGPTASGKTAIAIELAKKIGGEIISADSMQVYKYMNIGTAKATNAEMDGIPHYLIDEFFPDQEFSVAIFKERATKYIDDILKRKKVPILVGGTGFYINSVVFNNDFKIEEKDGFREELAKIFEKKGENFIFEMLKEFDPVSSENMHPHNVKRVMRAIEFYHNTGMKISEHNELEKNREEYYNTTFVILNMDREKLYDRINIRVDKMFDDGLVKEVENLLEMGYDKNLVSMSGLGYKEIIMYLEKEISLEESSELLKKRTRNFAKRQLTWFRHQTHGSWFDINQNSKDEIVKEVENEFKRNLLK